MGNGISIMVFCSFFHFSFSPATEYDLGALARELKSRGRDWGLGGIWRERGR